MVLLSTINRYLAFFRLRLVVETGDGEPTKFHLWSAKRWRALVERGASVRLEPDDWRIHKGS